MNFRLRQLHHAVVLADAGTYSAAAKELHISQPALSRSIQALERQTGARLFDRTRAGVQPTAVGEVVVGRGRVLLASASDLEREIGLTLGLGIGSLRIGAGPYPAQISVSTACARLIARHPELELDVRVGDWQFLTRRVLEGRIDLAVAELSIAEEDDRLVTEPLPRHHGHLVVRAGHPLAGQPRLELDDALKYPLVTSSLPARIQRLRPSIRVDTVELMSSIMRASDAVGLATSEDIAADSGPDGMVRLDIDLPWLHTAYGFIRLRERTPSPAEQAFMDILREVEAGLAGEVERA